MAYPRSLWSSVPRGGFPPSSQPSSAPPPRALDKAGYPSYPFADPDKTYSPAEFASKFPAQPPKYTQDGCTSVADRELPNTPSTSPQRPGRYSHVHTNTDPATSETHLSEQRQSIQAGRPGPIDVSHSVLKDTKAASSDLNHSPTSATNSSGRAIQPPEVPTQSPYSVQLLDQSIDPLTIASQPAPPPYQGAYQSIFNRSSPPSALHASLLDTYLYHNSLGAETANFGKASALGSNHSDTINTADTSPIRRQAHVFTLDQLETMPKRARSVDSVDSKAKSTNASSDSTTDSASDFADQAAASTDMGAAPSNVDRAPKNEYEARIIKAASKCNHIVAAYRDLAPDESTKRRGPMYMSHPPPYITDEEEKTYREQYEVFIGACNGDYGESQSVTGDKASHARQKMKALWFKSRRFWAANDEPLVEFGIPMALHDALVKSSLADFMLPSDEKPIGDDSTDSTLTDSDTDSED